MAKLNKRLPLFRPNSYSVHLVKLILAVDEMAQLVENIVLNQEWKQMINNQWIVNQIKPRRLLTIVQWSIWSNKIETELNTCPSMPVECWNAYDNATSPNNFICKDKSNRIDHQIRATFLIMIIIIITIITQFNLFLVFFV